MKVTALARPSLISAAIEAQVTGAITQALKAVRTTDDDFIVNDLLWFAVNDRGKVTPCAMNSAKFISKKFLDELKTIGWTKEKSIIAQKIDAYLEIPDDGKTYRIADECFLEYFASYTRTAEGVSAIREIGALDRLFTKLYRALVSRSPSRILRFEPLEPENSRHGGPPTNISKSGSRSGSNPVTSS